MPHVQGDARRALLNPDWQTGLAGPHGAAAPGAMGAGVAFGGVGRAGAPWGLDGHCPFRGRAGHGGEIDVIRLRRVSCEASGSLEVRLWPDGDELAYALAAPAWDRFGAFAGHPLVCGEVIWTLEDRAVVIAGRRGDRRLEEPAG